MKNKGADMDDRNFKALTGLRAIYEQRACPPDEVLFARERSREKEAHLGYCRYCNERLEMTTEDHRAWQELGDRLKPLIVENGQNPSPAPGQIWSLDRERLGGWGPYDRYYNPPLVLVLQLQDNGRTVRVAQVCAEEDLKGDDGADVWLDEGIGFAESWNVYSVHRDDLKACRGEVDRSLAKQVLEQSRKLSLLKEVSVDFQRFRELEVQVGAFVAMRAMPQVVEEVESVEEWETATETVSEIQLHKIFGPVNKLIERAVKSVNGWDLLENAQSVFDFLAGAQPKFMPGYAAVQPQEHTKPINIVSPHEDGLFVGTVTATITAARKNDDGNFFIRCSLNQKQGVTCHLFACLELEDLVREVPPIPITAGTKAFAITFPEVPAWACNAETAKNNVKMILVRT